MGDVAIAHDSQPNTEAPDLPIATPQLAIALIPRDAARQPPAMQVSQPEAMQSIPLSGAIAQLPIQKPEEATGTAEDLRILPRVGIGHTSSGGGYDGTTRFEGFLPLFQTTGRDVAFLEGRLLLDNDANVGGNLVLGYRAYSPTARRTFGGHVAYDSRDTDENSFDQLGVGFESLGDVWDFRINGYLPIGDRQQEVGSGQLLNSFFRERSLIVQERNRFEAAVGSVDVEAGAKLAELGDRGDLRGYGGLYWYDAPDISSGIGWRLRLEARPNDYLSVGLGVQSDELFGTNILARVGLTFPGRRPRRVDAISPDTTVVARLGETIERNSSVVITAQDQVTETTATNPETGQTYVFQHVDLGRAGGDGTIENPYGTIQPALDETELDGNAIVYVQAGSNPGIPGFTIPDGVQVLSAAPVQRLNTRELGVVRLPLSGTGVRPRIADSVFMGENTTLAGFDITGSRGAAVVVSNVGDVTIRQNRLASAIAAGILLENTTGTITIADSTVTANGVPVLQGDTIDNLEISNSQLISTNSTTDGIALNRVQGTATLQDTAIAITTPAANGIALTNITGSVAIAGDSGTITNPIGAGVAIQTSSGVVSLSGLQVTGAGTDGIRGDTVGTLTLENSAIANSTNNGIALSNISESVTVSNTTINGTGQSGIVITNVTDVTLADSTIETTTGDGITLTDIIGSAALINSTVANTGQRGIAINQTDGQLDLTIAGNQVSNTGASGIDLTVSGNAGGTAQITDNAVTNAGQQGIAVNVTANDTTFRPVIEASSVTESDREAVAVFVNGTTQVAAGVRLNQFDRNNLSNTAPAGVSIINNVSPEMCVQLRDNVSRNTTTDFNVQQNLGNSQSLDLEPTTSNTGTFTAASAATNAVLTGTCGF